MDSLMVNSIVEMVIEDSRYFTAIFGLIGVITGAIITVTGNVFLFKFKQWAEEKKNLPRKKLLLTMLEDKRFPEHWRKLDTLMHVIGANEKTTKQLLLEVGARASEDKQDIWGLIKYHPLDNTQ